MGRCLPDAPYREALRRLHADMLAAARANVQPKGTQGAVELPALPAYPQPTIQAAWTPSEEYAIRAWGEQIAATFAIQAPAVGAEPAGTRQALGECGYRCGSPEQCAKLGCAGVAIAATRDAFRAGYEAAQQDAKRCDLPPLGWRCTRTAGHEGPCAAVEAPEDAELVAKGMARLRESDVPVQGSKP